MINYKVEIFQALEGFYDGIKNAMMIFVGFFLLRFSGRAMELLAFDRDRINIALNDAELGGGTLLCIAIFLGVVGGRMFFVVAREFICDVRNLLKS